MDPVDTTAKAPTQREFPCHKCGAALHFAPGTTALACPYCGSQNEIPESVEPVEEMDFAAALAALSADAPMQEVLTVKCPSCGAESSLPPAVTADRCPFCGTPIIAGASSRKLIKPQSLLPFHITRDQAMAEFRTWLRRLWFAPNELLRSAETASMKGIYIPGWTYDSNTQSYYTGERGEDYWDTETYTTIENGKTVTRTRQVRKTRWWPVSGRVANSFDDVLVLASESLPRKYAEALEPWDLGNLVPYGDEYLSGFICESYQVDLAGGFERAKQIMDGPIRQSICADIGGDHQRISTVSTRYFDITYKHLLLPMWLSAYLYHEHTYHFMVNARSGEVQGERPWSWVKITLTVLVALIIVLIGVLLATSR